MEKVTVVVPFYNVEAYISECLDSLTNQTHENLEILCINDCSPDNTLKIVQDYERKDRRIKTITHTKNLGLGGARNTGIQHASSDYICFVDSDDYVSEKFIERLYCALQNNSSDLSICEFSLFSNKGDQINSINNSHENIIQNIEIDENMANLFDIANSYKPATWLKMYKRNLLTDNNIYQPENRYYEGVVFWLRSIYHSSMISVVSENLYFYRQRPGSIMNSLSKKHIDDRIAFIKNIHEFFNPILNSSRHLDTQSIFTGMRNYITKQLAYGYTLIRESSNDNKLKLEEHYENEILSLSSTLNWPDLPSKINSHDTK